MVNKLLAARISNVSVRILHKGPHVKREIQHDDSVFEVKGEIQYDDSVFGYVTFRSALESSQRHRSTELKEIVRLELKRLDFELERLVEADPVYIDYMTVLSVMES